MPIPADLHYILIMQTKTKKNISTGNNYNIYCTCKKWCASAVFLSCFTAQMSTIHQDIFVWSKWSVYNTNINIYAQKCVQKKRVSIKDMKAICSCFKYALNLVEHKTSYFHFASQVNACLGMHWKTRQKHWDKYSFWFNGIALNVTLFASIKALTTLLKIKVL